MAEKCLYALFVFILSCPVGAFAQDGFERLRGTHIDLITDLPLTDEVRELVDVFDAAVPMWCQVFQVDYQDVADWRTTAHLMLERRRFQAADLIPGHLPEFPHGFQYGDSVWVVEQPSAYYRRHLLLHEGTHWFMARLFGAHGPPWLMEGMADWLGTHRWNSGTQELTLGIIPANRTEVPFWGRFKIINEQLDNQTAPSLETIMRYDNTAHRRVEAYAWSWAVVLFLQSNERTQNTFAELFKQTMSPGPQQTRWLFLQLRSQWPAVRGEWAAFVSEMDYGFDPQLAQARLSAKAEPSTVLPKQAQRQVVVLATQGWQPSGVWVEAGDEIQVTADGITTLAQQPKAWRSSAAGVTLEYYRGRPLGELQMTILRPIEAESTNTVRVVRASVRQEILFTADRTGELHFKINEATDQLGDNAGELQVTITRPGEG